MSKVSRRGFLAGASASAGAIVGASAGAWFGADQAAAAAEIKSQTAVLKRKEKFYGAHQNGIELELQTFTNFVAFDLLDGVDRAAMLRWMSLLTDDIARLTQGDAALADAQPQLALGPARLTATVGFGPAMFEKLGLEHQMPDSFKNLPAFKIDALKSEFSGGDVLIHVSADDPIVLSHAVRRLITDSLGFASVRWSQQGFSNAQGVVPHGVRQRNLMGQVDGTDNPGLATDDFENLVWINDGPNWIQGGTIMVFRRIAMQLNTWDQLGRVEKEQVIGRTLDTGAPLGKANETDVIDFDAVDANGLKVIPDFAHIRRAHAHAPGERFFRRPFNYETGVSADGNPDVGLLWTAYQRNLDTQFIPVQRRLERFDLLNKWTTPIGSAVFAIAKGVQPGQVLAAELFA
ncbi:Dyp-type peroxidase [Rhodoluna sp. KAS3]|uniref:Dyp-type peroxidase n=1 Tax=Rhodoluna sp. KAS3 TaxID=942880 RepID=UPI002230130C|nr:Dyp-type peroxidase [Rhodoluna sp. KAS3]BDS49512.1 peroxidase [Rhodoluna sp. KAS3]